MKGFTMRQPSLFDTPPRREPMAPASNNTTSLAAAKAIQTITPNLREMVYAEIAKPGGRTDEEVAIARNMPGNTVRPRRNELVNAGRVVDSGETRLTQSGRRAIVWKSAK
jgi:hypothetical protein